MLTDLFSLLPVEVGQALSPVFDITSASGTWSLMSLELPLTGSAWISWVAGGEPGASPSLGLITGSQGLI